MNIAVMSDIHGFAPAFEAVLADIHTQNVDRIIVAGDLCEGGPEPARVVELIREHDVRCVYGNTDEDLYSSDAATSRIIQWTREQLGPDGLAYLSSLPFSLRIPHRTGNGGPATDLLVVHANPVDVNRHLSPHLSDREVREIIGDETAKTIAFGHLHVVFERVVDGTTLVDVSAVGNPRDGDLRPRYVIFSDNRDDGWSHRYRYVDYPLEETRRLMEQIGMPDWRAAYARLESAH